MGTDGARVWMGLMEDREGARDPPVLPVPPPPPPPERGVGRYSPPCDGVSVGTFVFVVAVTALVVGTVIVFVL